MMPSKISMFTAKLAVFLKEFNLHAEFGKTQLALSLETVWAVTKCMLIISRPI